MYWVKRPQVIYSLGEIVNIQNVEDGNLRNENINIRLLSGNNEVVEVNQQDAVLVDKRSLEGIDDLLKLNLLNEANLLMNLSTRYNKEQRQIYTSIGSSIMISINPFQNLPHYDIRNYSQSIDRSLDQNPQKHLFEFAHETLRNVKRFQQNQAVIITGESGSGKTEAMKILLEYISNHHTQLHGLINQGNNRQNRNLQQQIIDNNFILESFGNAKTARNNNSSRFGKFIKVFIRNQNQQIQKAVVQSYLLEKSRVTHISANERNYHVFYQAIRGGSPEFKQRYFLGEIHDYSLLRNGDNTVIIEDANNFNKLISCFNVMGFTQDDIDGIFRIVSGILQLGNIEIGGDGEISFINENDMHLQQAVELLQLNNPAQFISAICTPNNGNHGTVLIQRQLTPAKAKNSIEGVCKVLYGKLFDWILEKINLVLNNQNHLQVQDNLMNTNIGILDIFGFEIFELNTFEQLCINYANEKIQMEFCDSVLSSEQNEYQNEGINWNKIDFNSNQETIKLFEGVPVNLFSLMEDQCRLGNGSDEAFVRQVNSKLEKNTSLIQFRQKQFILFKIKHYLGEVEYNSQGFIEKNKNNITIELSKIFSNSGSIILNQSFAQRQQQNNQVLSSQFKQQLSHLLLGLRTSTNFYVKCIKPNMSSVPGQLDLAETQRQIQCSGLLEVVKVRQAGFGIRMMQEEFIKRYFCFLQNLRLNKNISNSEKCQSIFSQFANIQQNNYAIGNTKVFFQESLREIMENQRQQICSQVTMIASYQKMKVQRKFYLFVLSQCNKIQTWWKQEFARKKQIQHMFIGSNFLDQDEEEEEEKFEEIGLTEEEEMKSKFYELEHSMQNKFIKETFLEEEFVVNSRIYIEELTQNDFDLQKKLTNTIDEIAKKYKQDSYNQVFKYYIYWIVCLTCKFFLKQREIQVYYRKEIQSLQEQLKKEQIAVNELCDLNAELLEKSKEMDIFNKKSIEILKKNVEDQNEELLMYRKIFQQNPELVHNQTVLERQQEKNQVSKSNLINLARQFLSSRIKEKSSEQLSDIMYLQEEQMFQE